MIEKINELIEKYKIENIDTEFDGYHTDDMIDIIRLDLEELKKLAERENESNKN